MMKKLCVLLALALCLGQFAVVFGESAPMADRPVAAEAGADGLIGSGPDLPHPGMALDLPGETHIEAVYPGSSEPEDGDSPRFAADEAADDSPAVPQDSETVALQEARERAWLQSDEACFAAQPYARMTVCQLRSKFPAGKYWNHANAPGSGEAFNNQDGWSNTPCPSHASLDAGVRCGTETCNGYQPGSQKLSFQCMGYAEKLGYDATGVDTKTWTVNRSVSALNSLKPGDNVRYLNDRHTIFVIAVSGDDVFFTDCNSDGRCVIRWNARITKSELRETFSYVRVCPIVVPWGEGYCLCSSAWAGLYTCSGGTTMRKGHGTEYGAVTTIPSGATVQVTRANGYWAHCSYKGREGYVEMRYLRKSAATSAVYIKPNYSRISLRIPDHDRVGVTYSCYGAQLPNWFRLSADVMGEGFTLSGGNWRGTDFDLDIVATGVGSGTVAMKLVDESGNVLASCDIDVTSTMKDAEIHADRKNISLNLPSDSSRTVKLTAGGYIPEAFSFQIWQATGDCFAVDWPGDWSDMSHDMRVTGIRAGQGSLVIGLCCRDILLVSTEISVRVTAPNPTVTPSASSVVLSLPDDAERIITFTCAGALPSYYRLVISSTTGTGFRIENAGGWHGTSLDLKVIGISEGSGSFTIDLVDDNTKAVLDRKTISVRVQKVTHYTVTYDANGGRNAPSAQSKARGKRLTLSSQVPSRNGYSFLGWATRKNASSAEYHPGGVYERDADLTLYAVWKKDQTATPTPTTKPTATPAPDPTLPGVDMVELTKNASMTVDKGAVFQIVVADKRIVACKSSAPGVAAIDDAGYVTVGQAGKAKLTVTTADKKKVALKLTVVDPYLPVKVSFAEGKKLTCHAGDLLALTPVLSPNTAVTTFQWSTSKAKVADVTAEGLVRAVAPGKAKITVKTANGKKASIAITVLKSADLTGMGEDAAMSASEGLEIIEDTPQ